MLCHFYTIETLFLMFIFSYPIVTKQLTIISTNNTNITNNGNDSESERTVSTTSTTSPEISVVSDNKTQSRTNSDGSGDLTASASQSINWFKSAANDHNSVKPNSAFNSELTNETKAETNPNSSVALNRLLNVFKKSNRREDSDLGLPPDIAHEYIDAVNPPKFQIPVQYTISTPYSKSHYITSSIAPLPPYEHRIHAGSSVVKTKANLTQLLKSNNLEISRNSVDLATLLKAELDAKNAELDQTKSYTAAPNLFALLPSPVVTNNPFLDNNYKSPNRYKSTTMRPPPDTSASDSTNYHSNPTNMGQFLFSEGMPSIRLNVPSDKQTIAITTPNSISLISTSMANNVYVLKSSTTARPIQYTKMKIRTMSTSSTNRPKSSTIRTTRPSTTTTTTTPSTTTTTTTTTTSTTTKRPTYHQSSSSSSIAISSHNKNNKSQDWSSRVNYETNDLNDSESYSPGGHRAETGFQPQESFANNNPVLRTSNKKTVPQEDYTTEGISNKTELNDLDYADNLALNPNYTSPDGYGDYPGANYRLTTERLAYILIGSCCALSVLCLIVVAMSVRCRDMCDEYRSWKKAEKAALRWQRHQYRLQHHQQDLSRYFRTSVEPNPESGNSRPNGNPVAVPAPLFGPTCCHCISCSSSWLFRDANKAGRDWCCQRGYYHPAPRGKLPFGAASSVNTFMPRFANPTNNPNNCCGDDHEGDTDSLNTSDLMDNHHGGRHQHPGNCPVSVNNQTAQTSRQQLRRIAQPNGNHNWLHSSEMVDELHKKHSNINNVNNGNHNNNFRARNRQIANENIVVWNNSNDERLI